MIIRLTKKLADKIGEKPEALPPDPDPDPLGDWCANLFRVGGTQFILVTNSASLYSIVFPGRGITNFDRLVDATFDVMRNVMALDGIEDIWEKHILPLTGSVAVSKATNRSVLGSMNDFVIHAYDMIGGVVGPNLLVSVRLNQTPMGALKYGNPRERILKLATENK